MADTYVYTSSQHVHSTAQSDYKCTYNYTYLERRATTVGVYIHTSVRSHAVKLFL